MRRLASWLARALDGRDLAMLLGLVLVAAGLALESVALALIVSGATIFLLAVAPPIFAAWRGP